MVDSATTISGLCTIGMIFSTKLSESNRLCQQSCRKVQINVRNLALFLVNKTEEVCVFLGSSRCCPDEFVRDICAQPVLEPWAGSWILAGTSVDKYIEMLQIFIARDFYR
jgi:hypothetical protein